MLLHVKYVPHTVFVQKNSNIRQFSSNADNVRHLSDDAHPIVNVAPTKNVYSLANVFVRRHSSWIRATAANVKIHANVTLAASMPNAHHPIHRNVCARLASKAIHYRDASTIINVQHTAIHAHTEHSVSIRKAAINAFVRMVWVAIRIKVAVFWRKVLNWFNVDTIPTALPHWPACKEIVSARASHCSAVRMPIVNQKNMQLGADAVLVSQKIKTATVSLVSSSP